MDMMTKNITSSQAERVLALAQRKSGVTLADIAKTLHVSRAVAGSLIGDMRRKGATMKYDVEDGAYRA